MKCHICGNETEFTCDRCEEPVCEDCCVTMTIHNQVDYPLCTVCGDYREACARQEWEREHAKEEAAKKAREERSRKARDNYRKPENVAKRAAARAERKRLAAELRRKHMAEAIRIVGEMFRGM